MTATPTQILFLGGASGVGKSSVAFEVSAALRRARVAHALIDGDNLDASYPGPMDSGRPWLTLTNLQALWSTYREVGQRRLVYVNTVSVLEADELRDAVDPRAEVTAVLLEADGPELAARLGAREQGSGLDEHLARSARWSADLRSRTPDWVARVDTTGATITTVAEAVIALTGWISPTRRSGGEMGGESGQEARGWV
ncbi:adenylyl-sulfate kinase [Sanguibacter gelidistatuariae]|nr:adenylyl-sulfate kinase [Sanguibacter gelidistatuariae]